MARFVSLLALGAIAFVAAEESREGESLVEQQEAGTADTRGCTCGGKGVEFGIGGATLGVRCFKCGYGEVPVPPGDAKGLSVSRDTEDAMSRYGRPLVNKAGEPDGEVTDKEIVETAIKRGMIDHSFTGAVSKAVITSEDTKMQNLYMQKARLEDTGDAAGAESVQDKIDRLGVKPKSFVEVDPPAKGMRGARSP